MRVHVSSEQQTEQLLSGGWSCGLRIVECVCPPPAIARTPQGHRDAGAARTDGRHSFPMGHVHPNLQNPQL